MKIEFKKSCENFGVGTHYLIIGESCIHFFPKLKFYQFWGLQKDWYDRSLYNFGLGKFMLICW